MGLTGTAARLAVVDAAAQVGVPAESVEVMRIGTNAVVRLDAKVVARVAGAGTDAARPVAVARWLASVDYPAVRALDVPQPVRSGDLLVTFWCSVGDGTTYAPIADVARLLRDLHAEQPPETPELAEVQPFGRPGDPLPEFPDLDSADARFLSERYAWARLTFPTLPFVLPHGVIHGDANVGNVLQDADRSPVLIDLDSFALGPREWDLIQTALFYDRLGWHTESEYRTFVDVYGYDIMQWPAYPALADMREVAMTAWLARKAGDSSTTLAEAAKRVQDMRSGGRRRDWGAY